MIFLKDIILTLTLVIVLAVIGLALVWVLT